MGNPVAMSVFLSFALGAAACGDVARTTLELSFENEDLRSSTQQLLVVLRAPAESGAPCDALWGAQPAGPLKERAWLVDYPNATDISVMRLDVGSYVTLAYALPNRFDALCNEKGDADCTSSSVGPVCAPAAGGQRICVPSGTNNKPIGGGCAGTPVSEEGLSAQILIAPRP